MFVTRLFPSHTCTPLLPQAQRKLADMPLGSVQFRPTQRRDPAEALSRISATFKLADTNTGGYHVQQSPKWVLTTCVVPLAFVGWLAGVPDCIDALRCA